MPGTPESEAMQPGPLAGRIRLLFWITAAYIGVCLLRGLLVHQAIAALQAGSGEIEHYESLTHRLELYNLLFSPLSVACLAAFGACALACARSRGRALFIGAAVAAFVAAATSSVMWIVGLAHSHVSASAMSAVSTCFLVAEPLAVGLAMGGVLRILAGRGERGMVGLLWVALPLLIWPTLFYLAQMHGVLHIHGAWASFFLGTVVWSAGAAGLLYFAARARRLQLGTPGAPAEAVDLDHLGPGWLPAANGLRLYADALSWRLGITVFAYVMLLMGALGRSRGMLQLVAWVLPLAAVITGVAMIVGLYRFAQQPAHSPARVPAWFAFTAMVCASIADFGGLILTVQAVTANEHSYTAMHHAREAAETAQTLSVWAMAVGFVGLLSLLVAFGKLARYIGPTRLFGRVVGVASAILIVALVVVGFRLAISGQHMDLDTGVAAAVLVAGFALITVISYISLTRAVEGSIRERLGDAQALPPARVV